MLPCLPLHSTAGAADSGAAAAQGSVPGQPRCLVSFMLVLGKCCCLLNLHSNYWVSLAGTQQQAPVSTSEVSP